MKKQIPKGYGKHTLIGVISELSFLETPQYSNNAISFLLDINTDKRPHIIAFDELYKKNKNLLKKGVSVSIEGEYKDIRIGTKTICVIVASKLEIIELDIQQLEERLKNEQRS